jgi:hypothetical protein
MDVTLGIVVIGVVVVVSLFGAWAVGRNRRHKGSEADATPHSPESLKALVEAKELKEKGRYSGPGAH